MLLFPQRAKFLTVRHIDSVSGVEHLRRRVSMSDVHMADGEAEILDFLLELESDDEKVRRADHECNMVAGLLAEGYNENTIIKKYSGKIKFINAVLEFAKSRNSVMKKFSRYDRLWLDRYSASYSTPEDVGIYRSLKLAGKNIADLGSGAGMQAIFLSMNSMVTGIEIDKSRYIMSLLNNSAYETKCNFMNADATEAGNVLEKHDTVYSDPLRSRFSMERNIMDLEPSPIKIMSLYSGKIGNFVFDLPPMIRKEKLEQFHGELEYLSVDGRLSRLTLYISEGEERKLSAVSLPSGKSFSSQRIETPRTTKNVEKYIFLPDASLFYSELHGNYCNSAGLQLLQKEVRKAIYTGDSPIDGFMGEIFRVEKKCPLSMLKETLDDMDAGKVLIRYETQDYYGTRNQLEKDLEGNDEVHIFKIDDTALLSVKLEF